MDHQHVLEGGLESPNIPSPAAKFTLFPKLPAELRLNIWKLALPGTYQGALFFLFREVSRGAPISSSQDIITFYFSSNGARDMARGQQLQFSQEVIANSPLTDKAPESLQLPLTIRLPLNSSTRTVLTKCVTGLALVRSLSQLFCTVTPSREQSHWSLTSFPSARIYKKTQSISTSRPIACAWSMGTQFVPSVASVVPIFIHDIRRPEAWFRQSPESVLSLSEETSFPRETSYLCSHCVYFDI